MGSASDSRNTPQRCELVDSQGGSQGGPQQEDNCAARREGESGHVEKPKEVGTNLEEPRNRRGRIRRLGKLAPWTVDVENESKYRNAAKRHFNYKTMRSAFFGDRIKPARKVLDQQGSQGGTRSKTWAYAQQEGGQMDPELEWEFPPIGVLRPSGKGGPPWEPHTVNASLDEDRH